MSQGDLRAALGRLLLSLRYRVSLQGADEIRARGQAGILFLPNHPALTDPIILLTHLWPLFRPRALADRDQLDIPGLAPIIRPFGIRTIPDPARYGETARREVEEALAACATDLNRGDNVLLWPAGRIMHSHLEDLGGNSAVFSLLEASPGIRIVAIRTRGLFGSEFSRGSGHPPQFGKAIWKSLGYLAAGGLFFGPRRNVTVELHEMEGFQGKDRTTLNRSLESFYNEKAPPALFVPHTWWGEGPVRSIPDPAPARISGEVDDVPPVIRDQVLAHLAEMTGIHDLSPEKVLARDLGMDSLGRMELGAWLEQEFGFPASDPEALQNVSDVLLAACGQSAGSERPLPPPAPAWFRPGRIPMIPEGQSLTEVFLRQAERGLSRIALADGTTGAHRTYRDILTGVFALRPLLTRIQEPYVGIMLPASAGSVVLYMAVLFAGKIPVMVNWTLGERALGHTLEVLGVRTVLTSSLLLDRLRSQGTMLETLSDRFLPMETLGATIGKRARLAAFLKAHLAWRSLGKTSPADTAVVLFTSGSESLPKAVPLSHTNLLANLRDAASVFPFLPGESMLGCLPPFHSFGLTCTMALPLCAGIPAVYHPNPTEGRMLARICATYRPSVLVGTPTFLNNIQRAAEDSDLNSLRLVISGAEKCPPPLFETVGRRWPEMEILEGYGITECSPVVSVNRPEHALAGTIGLPLPSVIHAVVHPETGQRVSPGTQGLLLVRGPSIFRGYLHHDGPSPFQELEGFSWYRTGDLVRELSDGSLVFAGRLKRFVKLGGEMVSLPAIEEVLIRHYGRPEDEGPILAVEAAPSEQNPELVLFCVRDIPREEANSTLREAGFSPLHNIRRVEPIGAIPLLGTGKTDYRALRTLLTGK